MEDKLHKLTALLLLYRSNFHVLHFLSSGDEFYRGHEKAKEYYEMCLDCADAVVELGMQSEIRPLNYLEVSEVLKDSDAIVVDSKDDYPFDNLAELTDVMFGQIITSIEELIDTEEVQSLSNSGMRSALEDMHGKFCLQKRYLNKRVLKS